MFRTIIFIIIGLMAALAITAAALRPASIYKDRPAEQNPLEGRTVIFTENPAEPLNADGRRGHLEAAGERAALKRPYLVLKRALDVLISFGGLLVLSPLYLGLMAAIAIDDPGPVFFTQKRVGENKRYFMLHKFRTMKMNAPHDVPTHKLQNSGQYITRVGRFLRAHSLDELPQLWDIFQGNMSVVGPRPALWNQDCLTAERDKYGANDIRPGLTGWAQINGRDGIQIPEKAALDGEYMRNLSFAMDAKIFFRSLRVFGKDPFVIEGGTGATEQKETDRE